VKVTVERAPNSEAILNVELEWQELEKASDNAYRKLVQKYTVPGFRRGRAPRTVLERMLGREALYQEGLEELVSESYAQAIRDNQLIPLARPDVDTPPIVFGQPYRFRATVPVLSPVELGDYRALRFDLHVPEVTEAEVEEELKRIQDENAVWVPIERPVQLGDRVTADVLLQVEGRTISNLKDHEFDLVAGREGIFAGMDEQIVGMSEGETKEFSTTIPENYTNQALAGKEAHYRVTVKSARYKDVPALDDELAKTIGNYDSLEQLRASVRRRLEHRKRLEAINALRNQVIEAVVDQAAVEIHPILVDEEVADMINETKQLLEQQGLNLDLFLQIQRKTAQEYRKELEPQALKRVKTDLVLDAVAEREGITVSDAELQAQLDAYSKETGKKVLRVSQLGPDQRRRLVLHLRRNRVIQRLLELIAPAALMEIQASAAAEAEVGEPPAGEEEAPTGTTDMVQPANS
jgi:trigger factor